MARIGPLWVEDLISEEKVKVKTETDVVSGSYVDGEVKQELFGLDVKIKVELETDGSEDETKIIIKDEKAGDESPNHFKVEQGNYNEADLQNLDFMNAYKSEIVIKEENFSQHDLNKKVILNKNNNHQEELFTSELSNDYSKVLSKEKPICSDKPSRHNNSQMKTHSCEMCGKSFDKAYLLKRHTMIHTGEKPYSCDTCGNSFAQAFQLKDHKRIHSGEKPYSCDTCGNSFRTSSHLKVHKLIHTGEKPHSCDICSKSFVTSSKLKRHKSIHVNKSFVENVDLKHKKFCEESDNPFLKRVDKSSHTVHLRVKKKTELKKHILHPEAQKEKSSIGIQSEIKVEFPDDKLDVFLNPTEILCDKVASENDDDFTLKSEIVVKEESFFWDENNQQHFI